LVTALLWLPLGDRWGGVPDTGRSCMPAPGRDCQFTAERDSWPWPATLTPRESTSWRGLVLTLPAITCRSWQTASGL